MIGWNQSKRQQQSTITATAAVTVVSILLLLCVITMLRIISIVTGTNNIYPNATTSTNRIIATKDMYTDNTNGNNKNYLREQQSQQQQLFTEPQRQRLLLELDTQGIPTCYSSKLLQTCPYNSTELYRGTCKSNIQQMVIQNWCFDTYTYKEQVCCGTSSDDCCEINPTYLALFILGALIIIAPIIILFLCAYGRCCIWYPKLWNAKSNRGFGQLPSPSTTQQEKQSTKETPIDGTNMISDEQPITSTATTDNVQ
jgi:hypothetical protein